ncbi:MAG TPA: hypothetical protein VJ417_04360, partial [Candidatus Glassbacteria bacterium]|nr:hypothetical protein [Candidatus Glassbacteria bacterium]
MPERKITKLSAAMLYALLCLSLPAVPAAARTLYLAPGGDDNSKPENGAVFRTLEGVVNYLWGGDTLFIRNGIYRGGVTIRRGCKAEAPLVIRGESKYAIIRGSG